MDAVAGVGTGLPTWALMVALAVLVAGGLLVLSLRRLRPSGATALEVHPGDPPAQHDADPWAALSAEDREAFRNTARDFGWE